MEEIRQGGILARHCSLYFGENGETGWYTIRLL